MFSLKQTLQLAGLIFIVLLVAACGNTSSTGSGTTPTTAPTATSITVPALVKTAQATVNGASQTILTNAEGRTLYYLTTDTATTSTCTGSCAGIWPPLIFAGPGSPTSASSLTGTLSVVTDANGNQAEYNGHPLYTYSQDTAPGQTNGEGVGGKWYVATLDLQGPSAPQSTPTSSYNY